MAANYQLLTDKVIDDIKASGKLPRLLLHACCAPCESYVLEYLSEYFDICVDYYNPNIYPRQEYERRKKEAERYISLQSYSHAVSFAQSEYAPQEYYALVSGHEADKERGERCFICYELRLAHAALMAKERGYDYFTSTLSISPHKDAQRLNEIGYSLSNEYGVKYLPSDFKKRGGYMRSLELSREFGLYRQDYCGCEYSARETAEDNPV